MKQNQPYGNLFDALMKTAFTTHSYRWTPIGNMNSFTLRGWRNCRIFSIPITCRITRCW